MNNKREGYKRVANVASYLLCLPFLGLCVIWAYEGFSNHIYREDAFLYSFGFFVAAVGAFLTPIIIYHAGTYIADGFKAPRP